MCGGEEGVSVVMGEFSVRTDDSQTEEFEVW